MKKSIIVFAVVAVILATSFSAVAGENQMKTTFHSAWYGGLAGALVGGAILIFREDPGDHLDYIAYGFGTGVIVGAAYGMARSTKALAEIEGGKIKMSMPVPRAEIVAVGNKKALQVRADLLKINF